MNIDGHDVATGAGFTLIGAFFTALWHAFRAGKRLGEIVQELKGIRSELEGIKTLALSAHARMDKHLENNHA